MRSGKEYIIGGFISLLVGTFGCTSQEELRKVFSFLHQLKEVSGVPMMLNAPVMESRR